jgi:hypothetical protein
MEDNRVDGPTTDIRTLIAHDADVIVSTEYALVTQSVTAGRHQRR